MQINSKNFRLKKSTKKKTAAVQAKRSSNESSGQKTLTECSHKAIPYDLRAQNRSVLLAN